MEYKELIQGFALLISGSALFAPYALISKLAENKGEFGDDCYGKRLVTLTALNAQGGGVILFYGCYIITIGFIAAFLRLMPESCFVVFLIIGLAVGAYGLFNINKSLNYGIANIDKPKELEKQTKNESKPKVMLHGRADIHLNVEVPIKTDEP